MGYADYIWSLIKPLGVYSEDGPYNISEIGAIGNSLDLCGNEISEFERESITVTAEGYGLEAYEKIIPRRPVSNSLASRRNALIALLRIDESCFTLEAINNAIIGCGVKAVASETDTRGVVKVVFPDVRGIPDNIEYLKTIIEDIIPCHLGINYAYVYTPWSYLIDFFSTWRDIMDKELTWHEIEIYIENGTVD